MFTGIIEEVGRVSAISVEDEKRRITIACSKLLAELKQGDSISVSGICLTVVDLARDSFASDLAQETWRVTSFSRLRPGALVNLELPMRASGRFDGHIVQGHADGTGALTSLAPVPGGNDFLLTMNVPSELTRYIVAKGSLTVEGISLTVAAIDGVQVQIAIIPHTYAETNLHSLKPGSPVNIEVDVLAKYVARLVHREESTSLSVDDLVKRGF